MEKLTRAELDRLKLIGRNVLIELPNDTDEKERKLQSGLYASFLYSEKEAYAPVFGTVYKRTQKSNLRDGDQVFFHYLCWGNAQHSKDQLRNGGYDGTKISLECEGVKYLLMAETEVFFAKRDGRYIAPNDHVLLRGIPKDLKTETITHNGVETKVILEGGATAIAGIAKEQYRLDIAEVVAVPEGLDLHVGQVVYPAKDWDVPCEYSILATLGEELFYVHKDVLLAKREARN